MEMLMTSYDSLPLDRLFTLKIQKIQKKSPAWHRKGECIARGRSGQKEVSVWVIWNFCNLNYQRLYSIVVNEQIRAL